MALARSVRRRLAGQAILLGIALVFARCTGLVTGDPLAGPDAMALDGDARGDANNEVDAAPIGADVESTSPDGRVRDGAAESRDDASARDASRIEPDAGPAGPDAGSLQPSGPIVINSQDGTVVDGVRVTNPSGDCISITNAKSITVRRSDIGPCHGRAVHVSGSSKVTLVDNYLHSEFKPTGCCDSGDGVFAEGSSTLLIQGNVIAYGESNIELQGVTDAKVIGNFLLNPLGPFPRGQQVQSWSSSSNITVTDNYAVASTDASWLYPAMQEDALNFGETSGVFAQGNFLTGGQSDSGCGLMADDAADSVQFLDNILLGTGQCGIGIASGTNQVVTGNKILNTFLPTGSGNTALYIWSQYPPTPCGPVTLSGNIAYGEKPDGTPSSYWNGGGCEPVNAANNTWDAAAKAALSPSSTREPPPAIPPVPFLCVAPAPYVNNTAAPPCF